MKPKTLWDLMKDNAPNNGFCYSTYPYACMLDEAKSHASRLPVPKRYAITKSDKNGCDLVSICTNPSRPSRKNTIELYWWHK